jgi:hypothetical protein
LDQSDFSLSNCQEGKKSHSSHLMLTTSNHASFCCLLLLFRSMNYASILLMQVIKLIDSIQKINLVWMIGFKGLIALHQIKKERITKLVAFLFYCDRRLPLNYSLLRENFNMKTLSQMSKLFVWIFILISYFSSFFFLSICVVLSI